MNFFVREIKNRLILIIINGLYLLNILYYYKNAILFKILNKLVVKNNFEFYIIYTSITELFGIYILIIQFFNIQIFLFYFIYHIFTFLLPSLHKNEFLFIKTFINLILKLYFILLFLFFPLFFPILWAFLTNFQEPFMHLELKLKEFIFIFINTCISFQFYLITFILLVKFMLNLKTITKFRKLYYFWFCMLFLLLFDIFFGICFILFVIIEIVLFYSLLNNRIK